MFLFLFAKVQGIIVVVDRTHADWLVQLGPRVTPCQRAYYCHRAHPRVGGAPTFFARHFFTFFWGPGMACSLPMGCVSETWHRKMCLVLATRTNIMSAPYLHGGGGDHWNPASHKAGSNQGNHSSNNNNNHISTLLATPMWNEPTKQLIIN
jgi:hypothetical protein